MFHGSSSMKKNFIRARLRHSQVTSNGNEEHIKYGPGTYQKGIESPSNRDGVHILRSFEFIVATLLLSVEFTVAVQVLLTWLFLHVQPCR